MQKILKLLVSLFFIANLVFGQEKSFINKTNEYLSELSKDENFGLSISISKGEKVLLEKAFGFASREHRVQNEVDTKFNIASIGKLFTAVSILQLKEQGKIELHKTVGTYLPEFPNPYIRDSITIHQLLIHTSGLPLWFNETFDRNPKFAYLELKDYLSFYEEIIVDPSRVGKNNYSNVGFVTLGFLIEEVSKLSYKEYVNEYIFKPLEMKETDIWKLTAIIPKVAQGYVRPSKQQDWWKTNDHLNMGSSPAGGAYSSARDLIKFYNGLMSNQLINEASRQLMFSPKIKTNYGEYGYGIGLSEHNGKMIIGHLGGYYGIRGELMWYKDSNYMVSILANSDQTDYTDVSHFIKTDLTGTEEEKEAHRNTLDFINSKDFYKVESDQDLKALPKEGRFDESLIQIKGYYYFNNKDLKNARKMFYLNKLLFPDSPSAMNDFKLIEQ